MQIAVEQFLTRITQLEAQGGWTEADVLNLMLLKDNLLAFRNGISNGGPKGFVCAFSSLQYTVNFG